MASKRSAPIDVDAIVKEWPRLKLVSRRLQDGSFVGQAIESEIPFSPPTSWAHLMGNGFWYFVERAREERARIFRERGDGDATAIEWWEEWSLTNAEAMRPPTGSRGVVRIDVGSPRFHVHIV